MKKNNKGPDGSHGNGITGQATKCASVGCKHDVNLRKRGYLHFQIGLIIALVLVYFGLEASLGIQEQFTPPIDPGPEPTALIMPDIAFIEIESPKKEEIIPEKKTAFSKIKIVNGPIEIDPGPDFILKPVNGPTGMPVNSVLYEEVDPDEEIDFIRVEEAPVFPGCENVEKSERYACFKEKMADHIKRNLKYPRIAEELDIEGRVSVQFNINTEGRISEIQLRGPSQVLESEAQRIIRKLPVMTPGKQRGVPVRVTYIQPIFFKLKKG